MNKPTPIKEIHVSMYESALLHIVAGTPDAASWVEKYAPEFGNLRKIYSAQIEYHLYVSPLYDAGEVLKWIERQGN